MHLTPEGCLIDHGAWSEWFRQTYHATKSQIVSPRWDSPIFMHRSFAIAWNPGKGAFLCVKKNMSFDVEGMLISVIHPDHSYRNIHYTAINYLEASLDRPLKQRLAHYNSRFDYIMASIPEEKTFADTVMLTAMLNFTPPPRCPNQIPK